MQLDFTILRDLGKVDFYFLRHGKSEGNLKDIVQGHQDHPLSGLGREQAGLTGKWLADKGIRAVVSTPLLRGRDTARIVCEETGAPEAQFHPDLMEIDTGIFTGLTLDESRLKYPEVYENFLRQSWEAVDRAEKIHALRARAESAWRTLIHKAADIASAASGAPSKTDEKPARTACLAVSHAGILQWLIKATLGSESWFPLLPMGDCGIYHFSVEGAVTRWEKLNFQVPGVTGKR